MPEWIELMTKENKRFGETCDGASQSDGGCARQMAKGAGRRQAAHLLQSDYSRTHKSITFEPTIYFILFHSILPSVEPFNHYCTPYTFTTCISQ